MKRTKRAVICVNTTWNVVNFRMGVCRALREEGFEVIVVAPKDEYCSRLKSEHVRYFDVKLNNKGTNPFEDVLLTYRYYKIYRAFRPDIALHFTIKPNIFATLAAGVLRIPVVCNITGLGTLFIHRSLALVIAKLLYRVAMRIPKRVFFQNEADRSSFVRMGLVNRARTDLLPGSGIDLKAFAPVAVPREEGAPFRFLMISRLVCDKGIREYIEAARTLHAQTDRVECQLLGPLYENNPTAVTREELDGWIAEGFIRYLGRSDDVAQIIARADCIVLPSYREGMSRILLEAASMGKPIITTDAPGCREVVDDGVNGYLCKVANASDLTEKMRAMAALDHEVLSEMGHASREKAIAQFDVGIVIQKYLDVVHEVMDES